MHAKLSFVAVAVLLVSLATTASASEGCSSYMTASSKRYSTPRGEKYWIVTKTAVAYCWWPPYEWGGPPPASVCVLVGDKKSCKSVDTTKGRASVSLSAGRQYLYTGGTNRVCTKYAAMGWTPEGPVGIWGRGPTTRHHSSRCRKISLK